MRILFVVSDFPIRSETFILTQIVGLLERGHEVEISANRLYGADDLHSDFRQHALLERSRLRRRATAKSFAGRFAQRLVFLFGSLPRCPTLVLRSLNIFRFGKKALSLDLLDMALCFAHRPRYDVIHCHFGPNGNDAALLVELGVLKGKLVVTFHSYDVLAGLQARGRIYRRLVKHAHAVHSISDYNRRALEALGFARERIHDQPMSIKISRFVPHPKDRGPGNRVRILTVARLAPAKGIHYALRALAALRSRRPDLDWRYRVIGGGELLEFLQSETMRLRLEDRVVFHGPQDQELVRAALLDADIFLLPSLAEGLPIAIMEALATELPVIATDVGGVAEMVKDGYTGKLVPAANPKALEAALADLIVTPACERERLGANGRRLVIERHDTDAVTERLIEHYRALLTEEEPSQGPGSWVAGWARGARS